MAIVTKAELENAQLDVVTIKDVSNGSATINGTGIVTSRLGTQIKSLKKVIDDLATTDIEGSVVGDLNIKFNDFIALSSSQIASNANRINTVENDNESFDFFIDSESGVDASNGLTLATRKKTLETLLSSISTPKTIGVMNGTVNRAKQTLTNISLKQLRSGDKPVYDFRKSLISATWTLHSGTVWTTDITFTNNLPSSTGGDIINFNTVFHGVWYGEEFLEWMVGGADIAANITNVIARRGSFTLHKVGSTQQDMRLEAVTAGASVRLYVNLTDGSNPNGKNVSVPDVDGARYTGDIEVNGGKIIGNWSKDFLAVSSPPESKKLFRNVEVRDFGGHGCVGPFEFRNAKFVGAARKGMSSYALNRTFSGINLYTGSYYAYDLKMSDLDISNTHVAIYGHMAVGPTNAYNSLTIDGFLKIRNARHSIRFTGNGASTPIIRDYIQCNAFLDVDNIGEFLYAEGTPCYFDGGGKIQLGNVSEDLSFGLMILIDVTYSTYIRFKNTTFSSKYNPAYLSGSNRLINSNVGAIGTTLVLENCNDENWNTNDRRRFVISADNQNNYFNLVLNNSKMGDLLGDTSPNTNPLSFTATAGSRFGFGDRTGPQVETYLTGRGCTHNISGQTTIVNAAGVVKSAPGWK